MARDQMERLFVHRATLDRIDRGRLFEAALNPLDQRTLTGSDRAHQVEHLPALLALERSGMEIAHDLGNRAFDAEKFVSEKIIDLDRLVFIKTLGPRIIAIDDVPHPRAHDHVIDPCMRHFGQRRIGLNYLEIVQQGPAPLLGFPFRAISFDYLFERQRLRHYPTPLVMRRPRPPWNAVRRSPINLVKDVLMTLNPITSIRTAVKVTQ